MATLTQIESLIQLYARARGDLTARVLALHDEIHAAKRRHLGAIKRLAETAANAHNRLHGAVAESSELFQRPKTLVMDGIKVGWGKQKGKVEWDDEAKVIARIRRLLPEDQAELLIRTAENVHKPSVYDLAAADLKRLGIRIVDDGDKPVVKCIDSEIDKLVDALLAERNAPLPKRAGPDVLALLDGARRRRR